MIRFQCPGCAAEFNTPDDKAGKSAKCPQCASQFLIPSVEEAAPESPPEQSFEVVPDERVEVEPCPGCGARLAVAASDTNKNVDCPYCAATFKAKAVNVPRMRSQSRELRRDEDDDPREDRQDRRRSRRTTARRRSRRDEKPGNVTAVGVLLLVGGIWGLISALLALVFSMFLCCLWPFLYLTAVWSIFAVIRGSTILGNDDRQPAPTTLFVLQILAVFNGDIINCILGIVGIILLNDERTRAHFEGRRPEE